MAFAKSTQARHPLFPAFAGALTTLQTPLRPRPLDRNRGLHYRGPWHLPGPDSHRLAAANLAPGYVMTTPSVIAPGLLDARGSRLRRCSRTTRRVHGAWSAGAAG